MGESIRIPWTSALVALGFQILALMGVGRAAGTPEVIRPWLYGADGIVWAALTWRSAAMRIRVSSEGIRSHGVWRTRFVPWDDLVLVETQIDWSSRSALWEYPTAILFNGRRVRLTGVYGLRAEGESRMDRIVGRLNELCDES